MPFLLTMGPQLTIDARVISANVGAAGLIEFRAVGNVGPVSWKLLSSTLPAEWDTSLTVVDSVASLATAEVDTAGTYTVRVRVVDTTRQPVERTLTIRSIALPLGITGSAAAMTVGTAASGSITITGGRTPYTVTTSTLPVGVTRSLAGDTITIAGTPTTGEGVAAGVTGSFAASITVQDADGATVTWTQSISYSVPSLTITGTPLVDATVGVAYSDTLTVAGGIAPYTLVAFSGAPSAIVGNMASPTIMIDGTPATGTDASSPYTLTVGVEDSEGNAASITPSLAVAAAPVPYNSLVVAAAPLLWWKLEETSGTTAADSTSSTAHDGTLNGGANFGGSGVSVAAPSGYAGLGRGIDLSAASVNDVRGALSGANVLDRTGVLTGAWTVVVWVAGGSATGYLMCRRNDGAVIYNFVANTVEFFAQNYNGADPRPGSQISLSSADTTTPHMVVYRYNSGTWSGFKDGASVFSVSRSFNLFTGYDTLHVGSDSGPTAADSRVWDVQAYDRALSDTEIADMYAARDVV